MSRQGIPDEFRVRLRQKSPTSLGSTCISPAGPGIASPVSMGSGRCSRSSVLTGRDLQRAWVRVRVRRRRRGRFFLGFDEVHKWVLEGTKGGWRGVLRCRRRLRVVISRPWRCLCIIYRARYGSLLWYSTPHTPRPPKHPGGTHQGEGMKLTR